MQRADLIKKPMQISLKPVKELLVTVRDIKGALLDNVEVLVSNSIENMDRSFNTNQMGTAICAGIFEGGRYSIGARKRGYFFEQATLDLPEAGSSEWKDSIELRMLDANRTQKGKVVYSDGKPASGAMVQCIGGAERSTTDANGGFTLPNLPDCNENLYACTNDKNGSVQVNKDSGDVVITLK